MKFSPLLLLVLPISLGVAGCTSQEMGASDNPHPRRTYNSQTGDYEGPTPMPPANSTLGSSR